ncbi:hypothetical protein DA803_02810 [[Mycoplasma] phocae]|uniref:Lipoprotein n=1 Tax=[Mycoplasma] phocae TaxID=142651 RepID=A0A2Z5IQI4_9BACT|nr:hypothetical protein [[Mycoplasma] phocae]AXE60999.1 hypothetical protein DA803_02810 [[Mycoplasma] phocae]
MNKKQKNRKFKLGIALTPAFISIPLILASCEVGRPAIKLNQESLDLFEKQGYHVKGSASSFNSFNYRTSNPIHKDDKFYQLRKFKYDNDGKPIYRYEPGKKRNDDKPQLYEIELDSKSEPIREVDGSFIYKLSNKGLPIPTEDEKLGKPIHDFDVNNSFEEGHKYKLKDNFNFLELDNLSTRYDYRIFSFTWAEFEHFFPYASSYRSYSKHSNNPKALFLVLYWILKTNEAAPNARKEITDPSTLGLIRQSNGRGYPSNYPPEEAPLPYFPGIISGRSNYFWKDATDPIVVIFEDS